MLMSHSNAPEDQQAGWTLRDATHEALVVIMREVGNDFSAMRRIVEQLDYVEYLFLGISTFFRLNISADSDSACEALANSGKFVEADPWDNIRVFHWHKTSERIDVYVCTKESGKAMIQIECKHHDIKQFKKALVALDEICREQDWHPVMKNQLSEEEF